MGVSKNRVFLTPQNGWLVYNGKPYEQMDDLGGPLLFFELESPTDRHFNSIRFFRQV